MFTLVAKLIHLFISSSYDPPPLAAPPAPLPPLPALSPRLPADCRNINVIERRSGGGSPTSNSAQPPVSSPQAVRACAPQPNPQPPINNKTTPMEKPAVPPKPPRSRIGGFLSRFANFRFSSRKKQKKDIGNVEDIVKPSVVVKSNGGNIASDTEAVVLKAGEIAGNDGENFVYIPLKPAMGRPPLPPGRQPRSPNGDAPLKKPNGAPLNSYQQSRNQEIKNNDSVDSSKLEVVLNQLLSAERGDLERRDSSASECYKGGLLETDLDTETTRTVHLVGNRARSLLQLPPPTPVGRTHKSMEYLLDKENLRCVEVSVFKFK